MLAHVTLRAKLLVAIAVGCAGYVVWVPDTSQTVEPAHTASAAHIIRPPTADSRSPIVRASFREQKRIVEGAAIASLFPAMSWFVAPPPPPPAPFVAAAPPVPSAPALPFAYMGSYRPEGAPPTFFLTAGDRVYDVKVGDTLDNTYSVDGVKSGQLLLTYMPLKIQQSIAVGDEQ